MHRALRLAMVFLINGLVYNCVRHSSTLDWRGWILPETPLEGSLFLSMLDFGEDVRVDRYSLVGSVRQFVTLRYSLVHRG